MSDRKTWRGREASASSFFRNYSPSQPVLFDHIKILSPSVRLDEGAILVDKGQICQIGPRQQVMDRFPKVQRWDASDFLVTPGWINAHTHVTMGFLRGLGHGQNQVITDIFFRNEKRLRPEWVQGLSYSYIYSGLKAGVTCFGDHYYFTEEVIKALEAVGVRGYVGQVIADKGGPFPSSESWTEARELIEKGQFSDLIQPVVCPHSSSTVSLSLMKEVSQFASKSNLPLHFHLSQNQEEWEQCKKEYGCSPVEWALKAGALGENSLVVHLTSVNEPDLDILKNQGVTVGFCPASQILYDRLAPLDLFLKKEIPLALATDGAASNDASDLHRELWLMALLSRHMGYQKDDLNEMVFRSVTQNPAKCFMASQLGDFTQGSAADLVFRKIDLDTLPDYDPLTTLLYSYESHHVEHVMVAGQWVLWDGEPVKISRQQMMEQYQEALEHLKLG